MDESFVQNDVDTSETVVRLFRDWVADHDAAEEPRELAGYLWREGEVALLVGESGAGKSVFAVEVADRITEPYDSKPLDCTVDRTNVLYVDLEMTKRQIGMRYTYELDPGDSREDYEFNERLFRMQLDPLALVAGRTPEETAKILVTKISTAVREKEIKVVVIDSITALKRSYYGATELMPIIRRLRHSADRQGLSILITAAIAQRESAAPLTLRDLGGLRLAASCVDTVFAIARCCVAADMRYIKHLTSRNSQVVYDRNKVLVYEIGFSGNFLGLEFATYWPEAKAHGNGKDFAKDSLIEDIVKLRNEGHTLREIALEVGRSKTTVGKYLQLYRDKNEPFPDEDDGEELAPSLVEKLSAIINEDKENLESDQIEDVSPKPDEIETDPDEEAGVGSIPKEVDEEPSEPPKRIVPYDFPGWEQYDSALRDPRLIVKKGMKRSISKLLKRERSIIEAAAVEANRRFVENGVVTALDDCVRLSEFRRQNGVQVGDRGP